MSTLERELAKMVNGATASGHVTAPGAPSTPGTALYTMGKVSPRDFTQLGVGATMAKDASWRLQANLPGQAASAGTVRQRESSTDGSHRLSHFSASTDAHLAKRARVCTPSSPSAASCILPPQTRKLLASSHMVCNSPQLNLPTSMHLTPIKISTSTPPSVSPRQHSNSALNSLSSPSSRCSASGGGDSASVDDASSPSLASHPKTAGPAAVQSTANSAPCTFREGSFQVKQEEGVHRGVPNHTDIVTSAVRHPLTPPHGSNMDTAPTTARNEAEIEFDNSGVVRLPSLIPMMSRLPSLSFLLPEIATSSTAAVQTDEREGMAAGEPVGAQQQGQGNGRLFLHGQKSLSMTSTTPKFATRGGGRTKHARSTTAPLTVGGAGGATCQEGELEFTFCEEFLETMMRGEIELPDISAIF